MRTTVHLRVVVPLLALALVACTDDADECSNTIERSYTVSLPASDAQLAYAVDTCRVDGDACPNLCQAILMRQQIETVAPATCDVRFTSDEVKVDMKYEVAKPSCAVPQPVSEPGSNF